eukprot:4159875-Heterocapsa_arctica.AAC.1
MMYAAMKTMKVFTLCRGLMFFPANDVTLAACRACALTWPLAGLAPYVEFRLNGSRSRGSR